MIDKKSLTYNFDRDDLRNKLNQKWDNEQNFIQLKQKLFKLYRCLGFNSIFQYNFNNF